jgi:hypothetical protein
VSKELTYNQRQYRESLTKLLGDRELRILFWRIICEDCKVFQEDFPMNATAYSLLAKQEIGKRLLADAKTVNAAAVFMAESEYNEMMEQSARLQESNIGEE